MKNKLAQYKQYKEELSAELRKYVQDKNNSLDERFEALCECPELSIKIQNGNTVLEQIFGTADYTENVYELTVNKYLEINTNTGYWFDGDDIKTFKEYCCDNFISSMVFDW